MMMPSNGAAETDIRTWLLTTPSAVCGIYIASSSPLCHDIQQITSMLGTVSTHMCHQDVDCVLGADVIVDSDTACNCCLSVSSNNSYETTNESMQQWMRQWI